MKNPLVSRYTSAFAAVAAAFLLSSRPLPAQNTWNALGSGGNPLWSTPANWGYFVSPTFYDIVSFDQYGCVPVAGQVNNIVDAPFTISGLAYSTSVTNGYVTTQINPGLTLSLAPQSLSLPAIGVGEWALYGFPAAGGANDQVYATIVGTNATLSVNAPGSLIRIEQPDGTSGSHWATLDMSRLSTFSATVSGIFLGADLPMTRPNGTLILAQTNSLTVTAAGTVNPGILLGTGGWASTDGGAGNLTLGVVNNLNADWLAVGGHRGASQGTSTLAFGPGITNATFKLRGTSGGSTRAALFCVGDNAASDMQTNLWGTSRGATGVAEFRGNTVDILVDSLIVGRNLITNETTAFNTGATGVGTGTLNFDAGTIDVNNLYLGYKIGTNYGGATGTLLANGGTLNVNNNLLMTFRTRPNGGFNGGNATATLTIASNAVANVKCDIVKGTAGQGTSTLNLNFGGLLNMQPAGDTVPGNVTVDNLTINGGNLVNVSNLTASGTFNLTGSTVSNFNNLSVGTLNLNTGSALLNFSNLTASGTINMNGGIISNVPTVTAATLAGSGTIATVNNVTNGTSLLPGSTATAGTLNIGGNLTLKTNASLAFALSDTATIDGGVNSYVNVSGNLNLLATNVLSIAPLAPLSAGPYRLMDYAGTLAGAPVFTNNTRFALGLDLSTAGQINLTNGGGTPGSLVWAGSTATGGTNWNLLAATNWNNNVEPFFQFDSVTFDANGVTTNINLAGLLYPQSITVNDMCAYTLGGSGKISGNAGITKNGSGQLWLTDTGGNDFNGNIAVNAGILKIARADSFGSTNGTTTIASGAMLDLAGTGANSPGEFVTISGNGITNAGAIINTGADQNNGLRFVSLAADSSIGNWPGRWDVRGPGGNATFSGGLYLNGFTLTKVGAGKNELADVICTNGGSLVNAGGILAFTRSLVDGPGTITVLGTNMLQIENSSTGMVAKPIIFTGAGTLQEVGNSFTLSSPITNLAGLTIDNAQTLTLTNILSGAGAVTKLSAGALVLQAPDLCAGPTTISAGSVVLTNAASLANTPGITLASGSTLLDASGIGGLALGGAQTLAGSGTVLGDVATSSGTTLIPGGSPSFGTLTLLNNLSLNDTAILTELGTDPTTVGGGANDLVNVGRNLSLAGLNTIRVTPLAGLDSTTPYTVMTYSNTLSGGLANLTATSGNPRYTFAVIDPATTPNAIKVSVTGLPVSLVWKGGQPGNPTLWDSGVTPNWLNAAAADVFYPGDTVVFDDTALQSRVTITNSVLLPATMQLNNNSLNYTVAGTGAIKGRSLVKLGTGTFTLANAGTNSFSLGITNDAGTLAFNPPNNMTLTAAISDSGAGLGTLEMNGTNILALTGNNAAFNGPILVTSGTLRPGNTNALGTINGATTVASGATLDINGLNLGLEPIIASGAGAGGQGAIYNSGAAQNNALRNVTLAGNTTFGGTGRWDMRSDTIGSATLNTGNNAYKLTKVGTNQFSLVGAAVDGALGDVDVQGGIFSIESTTPGLGDASRNLTVFTNAILQLYGLGVALAKNVVLLDGGSILSPNGANYIAGTVTLNGSNAFNVTATSLTLNSPVSGSGSLYKLGANTLNLMTDNTFGGGVFVNGGTLAVNSSLGFTANKNIMVTTTTGGGGQSGTRITLNNAVIPPGVSVNLPSSQPNDLRSILYVNTGLSEWQGPINFYVPAGSGSGGSVAMAADSATALFTIAGPMTGSLTNLILRGNNNGMGIITGPINIGAARIEKTELCTWTLATNNNVWGDTIIHNGTLQLGTNNPCPVTTFLTLGENQAVCVLDLNGFSQQVAGLTAGATLTNDIIANTSSNADSTLVIAGANVTTYGGIISDALVITNTYIAGSNRVGLTLAATNSGSLTLSGTNAYSGPTLLNGGTLLVNGIISNTVVTLNSNATLGGNGFVLGPVSVNNGGTLALGPAISTLTLNKTLALGAGSTNVAKINADSGASDLVSGITSLAYGGTLVVNNLGSTRPTNGAAFKLFDAASYSGSFTGILPAQPGPGKVWDTASLAVNGTLKVLTTVDTTPTNLTAVVSGDVLTLSWPETQTGWRLLTNAVNVSNPGFWFTYPDSIATNRVLITIDQNQTNVFYRITYP
ncbi:MAG TPA: autotransporter-associated beta strand repeat-containing protein [Candidatus Acidoferrum sp.]|jgi:fibronectin-binding autotransporter adhesin|nr:autotransporter-associated beta strand repeat-containing protein [Candidatus Acidoferrum sp.]